MKIRIFQEQRQRGGEPKPDLGGEPEPDPEEKTVIKKKHIGGETVVEEVE